MSSKQKMDSTTVQRLALAVIAGPVVARWAKPSELMLNVREKLRDEYGIENPDEWARWAFRTRGAKT